MRAVGVFSPGTDYLVIALSSGIMDFTKFMNKFNEIERQLSPTSALRLSFDNISPETEEPENKRLWGVPVPPFVSDKVVSWIEEEFTDPPIFYNDILVLKKVFYFKYLQDIFYP